MAKGYSKEDFAEAFGRYIPKAQAKALLEELAATVVSPKPQENPLNNPGQNGKSAADAQSVVNPEVGPTRQLSSGAAHSIWVEREHLA